jgi:predicted ATPase/class 3 adenylate cyclase
VSEPAQIPTGTVTLLFTDIEGSTRLWEAEPEAMAVALRRHDDILRGAIEQAGGYVFKTVGDAFCAAFGSAPQAVDAVLAAQDAIGTQAWPTPRPIRVRMGLHTGVCEERDGDYFGPVVNRSARLEAVAHGGQVLLSGATAELLAGSLPGGTRLRDLGTHRLKDLGRAEQVFQLEADRLAADFPPLPSLDSPELPNNLPAALSAFVGRETEITEVTGLARVARLVTLTGAGGSGKTRLALQVAAELLGDSADAAWLADLAPVTDGGQIAAVVASVLRLPDAGVLALDRLTRALASQSVLLVLDNCEQVVSDAAKFCDHLLQQCPRARILVTSREPLGIDGEHVYRVPSLSLPDVAAEKASDLAGSDAVRLFAERASATDPRFSLTDQAAPLVASICRRLDGIPLALELAAARLSSMSLKQVTERLDQRFRLLTGGSRNAMPRQQTLRATVDWSFSLLKPAERDILLRLSVFAGGFDLDAAEAVCTSDTVDAFDVLDLLGSLVDKSLVVADRDEQTARYRLLETIRQYSSEQLAGADPDSGLPAEPDRVRDRHADYYLALAETAARHDTGPAQGEWLRRLDADWDNLQAALAHLAASGRPAETLRLGVALDRFVQSRGHHGVVAQMRAAVAQADAGPAEVPPALMSEALIMFCWLAHFFERDNPAALAAADEYAHRALALARTAGDQRLEAKALAFSAGTGSAEEDRARRGQIVAAAVTLARQTGDLHLLGELLGSFGAGTAEERQAERQEALSCFQRVGDDLGAAAQLHMLCAGDAKAGRFAAAEARLAEAIALAEPLGDEVFLYMFLMDRSLLLLLQNRLAEAEPLVRRCLLVCRRIGMLFAVGEVLMSAAILAAWHGRADQAARLHGAADMAIEREIAEHTITLTGPEEELRRRDQQLLGAQLGEEAYFAAYQAGGRLSPAEAVAVALGTA